MKLEVKRVENYMYLVPVAAVLALLFAAYLAEIGRAHV